jgi:2-keto-3-deoxy-L-rhamnonate aldolase RhmA
MRPECLKARLRRKELTIGSWLSFGYSQTAEMMAKSGFDWIVVDMEHSSTDFSQMRQTIQIIDLCNVPALVRVGANDPLLIKKALDAGAQGIIVPMIMSVEDARTAIDAIYYGPIGNRGVGLYRAQDYGRDFSGYRTRSLEETVFIVQIEHKDAVSQLEDILALDEVDGFIVGPYDMSSSVGVPGEFEHPRMQSLLAQVHSVANSVPKPGGFHIVQSDADVLRQRVQEGYRFLAYGTEMIFLMEKITKEREIVNEIRKGNTPV